MAQNQALHWGNPPTGIYNAPIYLGLVRRTFGPPDLRLTTRDNLSGADYEQALLAGEFDMGHMGTPPLFAALDQTDEYAIVGQGIVRYPCFWVLAPAEVTSFRDLIGKSIAVNKLRTCSHSIVRTLLRWEGKDESAIDLQTLVTPSRIVDAIGSGSIDAAVTWEPFVSYVERAHGWRVLIDGRSVIDPSNYGFCLYARRRLLKDRPDLVRRMMQDYASCVSYGVQHMDEMAEVLYGRFPGMIPEDIDKAVRRDAPNWTFDTTIDRPFFSEVLRELTEQSIIPADFELDAHLMLPKLAA